ncbi:NAD(P)-dependent oxidoreductase [Aliidongia dinghuensis]|uniref:NAD(P)-dependent oxidoreductase n=1 Tax=Aliidongia dinghuensis TaxID=1867774 RepID=A0A8J2YY69_9PROT|nr:NAD(P)-dependent oxidoreductase [Aliidongia dinghuensis]
MTRRPNEARELLGIEVAEIDFANSKTIVDALTGADRLFIAHGTSPQQVADEIALIDGAVAAGIDHVVKLSTMGPATRRNPIAWHMQIEAHLARQSIPSTVIRPSAFAEMLLSFASPISTGTWNGAGENGRVNFIDIRDVAEVARIALLENVEPESQRIYHITGPRAWSMQELVAELSRVLERSITYSSRTLEEQRAALLARGLPPFVADLLTGLEQFFRDSALAETTSTFEELTGKPPRKLTDWLAENVGAFRAA